MRNDKSLRYMIAPVNVVYSGMRTIVGDSSPETNAVRVAVDPSPSLAVKPSRPAVLVVMVGENHALSLLAACGLQPRNQSAAL